MTKFWGKILIDDKIIQSDTCVMDAKEMSDQLLGCIEYFSRKFDIEAPMWHSAHTKQMGMFKKATFRPDDFIEKVDFDQFVIELMDEEKSK